jgi:hypothetical protein
MTSIQVTFKGPKIDITIPGDSAKTIVKDYERVSEEIGKLLKSKKAHNVHVLRQTRPYAVATRTSSLSSRVVEIVNDGFFDKERTLKEVKEALAKLGIIKPLSTLSGVMQRLVKNRILRRDRKTIGKNIVWVYQKHGQR